MDCCFCPFPLSLVPSPTYPLVNSSTHSLSTNTNHTPMLTDFDYTLLPENYTLCLHDACPRAKECLRRAIAEGVPAAHISIRVFSPAAARQMAAAGCTYFRPIRKVRYARGIEAVLKQFEKLPYREARMARATLYGFFGRNMFYRIRHGERFVFPEEQEKIAALFRRVGLKEEPQFDEYIERYDLR